MYASHSQTQGSTMFAKESEGSSVCGIKGHDKEKCWKVIGYPQWHAKFKKMHREGASSSGSVNQGFRGNRSKADGQGARWAANAQMHESVGLTAQQLEQLLKLIPSSSGNGGDQDMTDSFAGMTLCNSACYSSKGWILDSGASEHMVNCLDMLVKPKPVIFAPKINLPTGKTACITHTGNVSLKNDLHLTNVLYVLEFRHNLLSVNKLVRGGQLQVFYPEFCVVQNFVLFRTILHTLRK